MEAFHRYLDADGDGIPARTLPGVDPKGAYFTRGSGHDRFGRYTEDADLYRDVVDRIARKIEGAAEAPTRPGGPHHRRSDRRARHGRWLPGGRLGGARVARRGRDRPRFSTGNGLPLLCRRRRISPRPRRQHRGRAEPGRLNSRGCSCWRRRFRRISSPLCWTTGGAPLSAEVVAQGVRDRLGLVPVAAG